MSASPPGNEGRGGARRILPSVSEVAFELARVVPADPAVLYQVSREVVAGELARVKQGLESAPLDVLVARARERLRSTTREVPRLAPSQTDLFAVAPPEAPRRPEPSRRREPEMPVLPVPYEAPEEPFLAASEAELGWELRGGEAAAPIPPPVPEPPALALPEEDRTLPVAPAPDEPVPEEAPVADADVLEGAAEAPAPGDEPARRRLWIAAVVAFAIVTIAIVWGLLRILSPSAGALRTAEPKKVEVPPTPVPAPVAAVLPTPAPTVAPTRPAPPKAAPARPTASKPATAPARAASFTTKDWAGRAPVYVLHFSSHQDRAAAASEAARLGSEFRRPARSVEVDLGAKGVWYRVVVGEFRSLDEARAFRADLAAKKTPGVGFVYEMRGSR